MYGALTSIQICTINMHIVIMLPSRLLSWQEGTPADEQGKTMLYAALKLRLSLVGSMLSSISSSESVTLDWVPLLMQLICSGAVDRQTDTRYIYHNY